MSQFTGTFYRSHNRIAQPTAGYPVGMGPWRDALTPSNTHCRAVLVRWVLTYNKPAGLSAFAYGTAGHVCRIDALEFGPAGYCPTEV